MDTDKAGYYSCMKKYGFFRCVCLGGVALTAVLLASGGLAQTAVRAGTQAGAAPIPKVVEKDGHWALMVDGAPYLMLGAQINNSSAWPGMLPQVWPAGARVPAHPVGG